MHKFYRSVLLTGMVAVGLAGCGDDVTVVDPPAPPPPPAPTVKSISVTPDGTTLTVGQTRTFSAAVVADEGVATTVTWSTSDAAVATINATSGVATGVAAGSVGIKATSTVNPAVQGNATLTVQAAATATVTGVTVTPASASLVVGQTVTASANVLGTNNPSQTVTWTSLSPAIASVNATTGLVTGLSNGTAVIKATSSANTAFSGTMSVTVSTPTPATVSLQSLTVGNLGTPVVLTNVAGQIEATVNVDNGQQNLSRVDVLVGGQVIASQAFGVTPAAGSADLEATAQTVVLSFNTNQLRKVNNLFVPVVFNGPQAVVANLYLVGSSTPIASNAIPVVIQNQDMMIGATAGNTLTPVATAGPVLNGGQNWYKGNLSYTGNTYVSFFPFAPSITWASNVGGCGSTGNMVSGTPQTGISLTGTFTCNSSVEGAVNVGGYTVTAGYSPAPDVIYVAAAGFTAAGSAFTVNGENRYNPITVAQGYPNSVYIDNKAPTTVTNPIGFLSGLATGGDAAPNNCEETGTAPGCWVGSSYNLLNDFVSSDAGSGVNSGSRGFAVRSASTCTGTAFSIAAAAENPAPDTYDICYTVGDNLGNAAVTAGFNKFGVDKTAPTFTYAGTYDPGAGTVNPKVVNVVPATVLDYSITDNNSGIDGTNNTGIKITRTSLVNVTGVTTVNACAVPSTALTGVAPAPRTLATPYTPDNGCNYPGQYTWSAMGYDRAGNSAGPIVRQLEYNPGGSNISLVAAVGNYAPSTDAKMNVWADDDEDLAAFGFDYLSADQAGNTYWWGFGPWTGGAVNPDAAGSYPGLGGFGFGTLGASWDNLLSRTETQRELTLPGAWVLRGFVSSSAALSTNQFQMAGAFIFDSWEQRTSQGWYGSYSYDNFSVPAQLRTAFSSNVNTWSTADIANILAAALINPSGRCTLEWTTLTNAPTIITRVWGHDNGLVIRDASGTPTLMSDNGIQRVYRLQIDAVSTCTALAISDVLAIDGDVGLYLIGASPGGNAVFPAVSAGPFAAASGAIRGKNQQ